MRQSDLLGAYASCGFSEVTMRLVLDAVTGSAVWGVTVKEVIDAIDEAGETALHYAARHGMDGSVTVLFEAGADPLLRSVHKQSTSCVCRLH